MHPMVSPSHLQPYHKPSKNQACCVFACHSPRNDLLPDFLWAEGASWGTPERERDKPGWPMLGQEPRGQQQQDTGRKDDSQKKTVPSHAGLQLGGAQLPTTRPDRGDSLRWLRGDLWWNLSLTVSALLTRVIMDHRLRATTAVGNFSVVMGAVGLSLGTGRLHLPFPLAHTTLLSATEQQWNQLCLVKPSVCPEPTSCVWAEHSLIHCW